MTYTFLILEDDKYFQNDLKRLVEQLPIESKVLIADTPEKAEEFSKHFSIDVFLIDIKLPDGKNGLDFMSDMIDFYPLTPIIVISAKTEEMENRIKALDLKVRGYLKKPYTDDEVMRLLKQAVEIASLINNDTITFGRPGYKRTHFVKNILCINRLPKGQKKIIVTSYDETKQTVIQEEFSIKSSLLEIPQMLNRENGLVRCHKGWLINPAQIIAYHVYEEELELQHGVRVPLGNVYRESIALFI